MAHSAFLSLPRELRDSIFEYALTEDDHVAVRRPLVSEHQRKPLPVASNDRWDWSVHYPQQAVSIAYLNLMLCNRQLRHEMCDYLDRARKQGCFTAKVTLHMGYPSVTPTWTNIPARPSDISTLEILLKIDHMYHPAYISRGMQTATIAAVFEILRRYIHRGPHLARPSALPHPLHLDTVRITIAPPVPFAAMTHIYGFPEQQLETLFNDFRGLLVRLGRSGIPFGYIEAFDVRMEGREWDWIPVTSNIWDEEDFVLFQYAGYKWDEDAMAFRPDQIPW